MSVKTEKTGGTRTNTNNNREIEAMSYIFVWNIFVTIFYP